MSTFSQSFNVRDIKTLSELDRRLVDLTKGKRDFECPDISFKLDGKAYKGNEIEREFTRKAQSIAMYNFFKYTIMGGLTGYVLSTMRRRVSPVVTVSIGTIVGSTFGVSKATINIMRHQIELKDSPIALESRYQLWRINPNHQWLQNHQSDVQRWNEMKYYGKNAIIMQNITDMDPQIKQHISQHLDKYEEQNYSLQNTPKDNELQEIQNQKRQRFYENREKLGHLNDSMHDQLYDYEQNNSLPSKPTRKDNESDDFQFSNDSEIRWG